MSQRVQRDAAILTLKWIFRLSQKEKKKKPQKGFYMQQIWQHNPTMNYVNIKPDELN